MSDQQKPQLDRWLLGVLLIAFALRAAAAWHWRDELSKDRDGYRAIADQLVIGHGFASVRDRPTAYRPPLYPLLLCVVDVAGGRWGIAAVQTLLGVATVWLTFLIGRHLGMGRGAVAAAGLAAVDPLSLRYTPQVMTETLFTFLAALLLWAIVRSDARPLRRAGLVGFVFGLCALCRPTVWAFGVVAAMGWVVGEWSSARNRKRVFVEGSLALAFGLLVIAPWVVRNAVVFGQPIVMTTHGGYTLLLGNNPVFYDEVVREPWGTVWQRDSLQRWQRSLEREMSGADTPPVSEPERDRWLRRRALRNIGDDPGGFAAACWLRFRRFWNVLPTTQESGNLPAAVSWGVAAFYTLLTVGMLAGLFRLRQTDWRHWWPLVALIVSFTAVHLVYWTNTRMRAPLIPVIALLCIHGATSISRSKASSERGYGVMG